MPANSGGDLAELPTGLLGVGDRQQASALTTRAFFLTRFSAQPASRSFSAALRAPKKTSWALRNRFHNLSSAGLPANPAAFHSVMRFAIRLCGRCPIRRGREFLGPSDKGLFGGLRRTLGLVNLPRSGFSGPCRTRPCSAELLPLLLLDGAIESGATSIPPPGL